LGQGGGCGSKATLEYDHLVILVGPSSLSLARTDQKYFVDGSSGVPIRCSGKDNPILS
jgi:hypothetical protein